MNLYYYGSVIYDVNVVVFYVFVLLCGGESYVLFLALCACDKVEDLG